MKKANVLVTGAGAGVGQGILRSLRLMKDCPKIVTADPDYEAAGHWIGDRGYIVPLAKDPAYRKAIESLIEKEHIDVVFVGTDVELPYFAKNKARLMALGATVVVCPPAVVEIADDKWLTAQFLKKNGFPHARSALATDTKECAALAAECGFPLFGKPRRGARSIGARIVKTAQEFEAFRSEEDLVFQEHLPDSEGEYTAGCIGTDGAVGGVVVLRRELRDGNTYRAYFDGVNRFEKEIVEVATALGIEGPCNFQFRIKDGKPVIFEINARCSGTTPLRAIFGFNEVEAILQYTLQGVPIPKPVLRSGAVFRAWSDIFVDSIQLSDFASKSTLEDPNAESVPFIIKKS